MAILQKGTRIANPSELLVLTVPVTSGATTWSLTADPRIIGGRIVSTEVYPATDIAKLNAIPTISASGVLTVTMGSASTAIATANVTIALITGNNV